MASFSIVYYTSTTCMIRAKGLTVGGQIQVMVRLADDPSDQTFKEICDIDSSTMEWIVEGLEPGTDYLANVNPEYPDSGWLGAKSFTTESELQRPWDWEWYSTIKQGGKIGLSALEWNHFCDRINEFRIYKGLSEYSFTTAVKGNEITASIVNEAYIAIKGISGHGTLPSKAVQGSVITASFFLDLTDALNSIS